jgi:hypothetical protein
MMNRTILPGYDGLTVKSVYYENYPEANRRVLCIEFDTPTNTTLAVGPEALTLDNPNPLPEKALRIAATEMNK